MLTIDDFALVHEGVQNWLSISGTPIFDATGVFMGYRGTGTNITNRKMQEEQLIAQNNRLEIATEIQKRLTESLEKSKQQAETANQAKSSFLATMSHEIRTPMAGVMGMADLLLEDEISDETRDKIYQIQGATNSLLRIINDILDISKMEAGKLDLEYIDFHAPSLIKDVMDLFVAKETGSQKKDLEVVSHISSEFPAGINSDPTRLRQILVNLIGNAVKFTDKGRVIVSAKMDHRANGQYLRFDIRDTGIGMRPETIKAVFEDFTQADPSIARKFEGTGLGLSICKRLVVAMDGEIGVNSEFGEGSTFWFTVPYAPAKKDIQVTAPARKHVKYRATRPLHILVAEDNKLNRHIISALLTSMGHTFVVAENGSLAIDALKQDDFDFILMDVRMPVMSGPDATRAIRQLDNEKSAIPIIALTADAIEEHRDEYLEGGMNEMVTKPIDRATLAQTINAVLGEEINVPVGE